MYTKRIRENESQIAQQRAADDIPLAMKEGRRLVDGTADTVWAGCILGLTCCCTVRHMKKRGEAE
jgi:hypothetical protein